MNHRGRLRMIVVQLGLLSFVTFIMLVALGLARANVIVVSSAEDKSTDPQCNLRAAIENHNAEDRSNAMCAAGSDDDTILVDRAAAEIFLRSPLPAIDGNLTLTSNDEKCIYVHGGYFTVNPAAGLTISGVGILNGERLFPLTKDRSIIDNHGGSVIIGPGLSPEGCLLTNHKKSPPLFGGVIFNHNQGKVIIGGADFDGNSATSDGGAIYNESGTIKLVGSPGIAANIVHNSASNGGGIYNDANGSIQLVNQGNHVVIAENSASSFGGGILNEGGNIEIKSSNFSISDNSASVGGGGIYSQGGMLQISRGSGQVQDIAIASNQTAGNGGGIFDDGSQLSISGIEIKGNSTFNGGAGAGLFVSSDNAKITQTYFHNNDAAGLGSAIASPDDSALSVTPSTFAGDSGLVGIDLEGAGTFLALNSTFAEPINIADSQSGRAQIVSSTLDRADLHGIMTVRNSIFQDGNCSDVVDNGFNLQFGSSNCPTSIPRADPIFDPLGLGFNGGPTPTIRILKGSAAIDALPLTACTDQDGKRLTIDQRGFTRPAPKHNACDIGAFEFGAMQPALKVHWIVWT